MRLIDADELSKCFEEKYSRTKQMIDDGEAHLDSLAEGYAECDHLLRFVAITADAVPVIRCRDCKHRGTNGCPMHINGQSADEAFLRTVDDDYCSHGERSDGEAVLGV